MICPEHLEVLGNLGYTQQESRFLYLVATHSGYFTLRQFLDFTGTTKGWNVHQFTSKSIRLGHVRASTCGYRTSVFNLHSRKVYGALDRDNLRNRRRLSSELIRTRLLILDFVLAHPALEYLETEAEKVAYFRELAVPEALIPGRVYKGTDPNSTTKRCFVDRFPVFFSAESECPPGESRNRSTANVPQEGRRNRPWRPSWECIKRYRSGGSAPISCPVTTTFLAVNPVWIAERELPRIVLYLVLRPVLVRRG